MKAGDGLLEIPAHLDHIYKKTIALLPVVMLSNVALKGAALEQVSN